MTEKSVLATQKSTNLHLQIGWSLCVCALLCCTQYALAESTGRIVKWKDDKGVTHYGDKIPPQYVNRENSVMNRQGVTVKHNKPVNYQEQAQDLARLEQDKKDKALLGAFTSANEIDLARDRNIQLDLIALENLNQDKANSQKRYTENKRLADSFTKRKKPIPEDLNNDIARYQEETEKIDQRISDRKQVIENTRKRFEEDKKRYLILKNQTASDTSTIAAEPSAAGNVPPTAVAPPNH